MATQDKARRAWAVLLTVAIIALPAVAMADAGEARGGGGPTSLGPFVMLSIAIERFWETVFTFIEGSTVAFGRLVGSLGAPLRHLKDDLDATQDAVTRATRRVIGKDVEVADRLEPGVRRAEAALGRATLQITGIVSDPVYIALKRTIILGGSLVIGPALALTAHITLFKGMGFAHMPEHLDMALTGIIIGTGSEPMHNVVNSLGSLRSALGSLTTLAQRGPTRDQLTVAVESARQPRSAESTAPSQTSSVQVIASRSEQEKDPPRVP